VAKKKHKQKAAKKPKRASRKRPATPQRQHAGRRFTVKQQRFIDAYAGDAKEAARKAKISYGYARQLLTKSNILEAIQNRQETEVRPKDIADRQERQAFWSKVMRNEKEETKDRLKASELLGKSEADFTENLAHRFPEGCGVMVVGGNINPAEWKKLSQAYHAKYSHNKSNTG
jgi:phage terminase small subunit